MQLPHKYDSSHSVCTNCGQSVSSWTDSCPMKVTTKVWVVFVVGLDTTYMSGPLVFGREDLAKKYIAQFEGTNAHISISTQHIILDEV